MPKKHKDTWNQLCKLVEQDDGLAVREIGSWTVDKLWWWKRYIDITTKAMVGRNKWPYKLVYVDLFAGPGILMLKGSRERVPGSPLIAANAAKPFDILILCEKDSDSAMACERRVHKYVSSDRAKVFAGDCNKIIGDVCAQIPNDALTLAFIDPTGLHAQFRTLQMLTDDRRVDLLILFADFMDIIRNVVHYAGQQRSNLDNVLGPRSNWRKRFWDLPNHSADRVSKLFVEIYEQQLGRHLGYSVFENEVLRRERGGALYRVMYASKHQLGRKFWRESTAKFREGGRFQFD